MMRRHLIAAIVCGAAVPSLAIAPERPKALDQLEKNRSALRTGEIEWSLVDNTSNAGSYCHEERFKTSRFLGADLMTIDRGNADGVVVRTVEGGVSEIGGREPVYLLTIEGQAWRRPSDPLQPALLFTGLGRQRDLRSLGLGTSDVGGELATILTRNPSRDPAPWEYHEARDGDLYVVHVRASESETTYWIDPNRGWSPVRVRYEHDRYGWFESRSKLKKFDGVWYPEEVRIFSSRHENGRQPAKIVRVRSASFNRPEHPQRLTPADIGVEVGTQVYTMDRQGTQTVGKWDGARVISHREFARRMHKGELKEGPNFLRAIKAAQAQADQKHQDIGGYEPRSPGIPMRGITVESIRNRFGAPPTEYVTTWGYYTRRLIKWYRLDEEQSQRALSILQDCEERADTYVKNHEPEFERLAERIQGIPKLKDAARRPEEEKQCRILREKLFELLDRIFEDQLKPRLEKIPTRAQRQATEKRLESKSSEKSKEPHAGEKRDGE